MRPIKFRAWNKEKQAWLDDVLINKDGELCQNDCQYYRGADNVLIMQYTGLKDRNGKEIYEGDILRDIEYGGDDNFWEVKFADACWEAGDYEMFKDYAKKKQEIIGNIWENPDLVN